MYPYLAKVMTKAWFHERSRSSIERLASRTQHIMHNGWHSIHGRRTDSRSLHHPLALLAAFFALVTSNSMLTTSAFALQYASLY